MCDAPKLCAEIIIHLSVEKVVIIIINDGSFWASTRGKMLWKLRGDNCLVGWFTELSLLKMRGLPVRWLVPGMTASWRHQGEARRGESNRRALSIKVFFFSFFAPCEICFHNLGVARVAFNIQLSNKELN